MELLRFAVEGEQIADGAFHADNVAPSLLGGMVLIRDNDTLDVKNYTSSWSFCSCNLSAHPGFNQDSRSVLKDVVSLKDMIKQQGNLASFIASMYTSDFELMKRSLQDIVIEPQRSHLIPHFHLAKEMALKCGAIGFQYFRCRAFHVCIM